MTIVVSLGINGGVKNDTSTTASDAQESNSLLIVDGVPTPRTVEKPWYERFFPPALAILIDHPRDACFWETLPCFDCGAILERDGSFPNLTTVFGIQFPQWIVPIGMEHVMTTIAIRMPIMQNTAMRFESSLFCKILQQ